MKRRLIPVILSLHLTVTFFPLTNTEPSTEPSPQGGDGMDRVSSDEDVAVIPLGSEVPRSASSTPTEAQGASGPRTPGARGEWVDIYTETSRFAKCPTGRLVLWQPLLLGYTRPQSHVWPNFLSFGGENVVDYAFRTLEDRQKIEKL